ncbi:MAG: hypothetical protein L3J56_00385 [Bacteroidales bacterium]|nr:hypothetical protein [Bacteroidales bacterium]
MKHSHFDCIGFKIKKDEDLIKMLGKVFPNTDLMENQANNGFEFLFYEDAEGVQMYISLKNEEFYGLNPHFKGKILHKLAINELITNEAGDLTARAWIEPNDSLTDGLAPVMFSFPNGFYFKQENVPYLDNIQLTAFGEDYKIKDEMQSTVVDEIDGQKISLADDYFIPVGLFQTAEDEEAYNKVTAQFAGEIIAVNIITNPLSNTQFYHLQVKSMIDIDVVIPKQGGKTIKKGQFIEGVFWLSGIKI